MFDVIEKPPSGQDKAGNAPDLTTYITQLPQGFAPAASFLAALGHDPQTAYVAGFPSQAAHNWKGAPGLTSLAHLDPERGDFYFSQAQLKTDATGRSANAVAAHVCLCVDDIGTVKGDRARWKAAFSNGCPRPTARLQTSPGSEQWFWRLKVPVQPGTPEEADLTHLRALLGAYKWSDPAAGTPTQYLRLPLGWNSKQKHIDANSGTPPSVELLEIAPEREVTVGDVGVALFGPSWRDLPLPAETKSAPNGVAEGRSRSADLSRPSPLLRLAQAVGLNPTQGAEGVVHATCPNAEAHTQDGREGTGFAFLSDDTCKCHHASCQNLNSGDFQAKMFSLMDEQEGRKGAGEDWWLRASLEETGALKDTAEALQIANAMADAADANRAAAIAHAAATNHAAIVGNGLAPFDGFDPKAYSPRPFLYGTSVISGFITVLAAPGGQGKTSVLIADILAMCSGRNLSGEAPVRPLVVQYHSAEDDAAEAGRRIAGAMKHHGLTSADLGGRLFVTSGRGKVARRIKLARMGTKGPEEVPGAVDAVVDLAHAGKVDVIAFDPLAAMHDLPENDNAAMNFLLDLLRQIADRTVAAIILTHHTSKAAAQDMDAAGAGAVRGASAVVDGSRVTRTLVRMTPKEAARFGVPDEQRRAFLRIEDAKVNLSPAGSARWVRIVGVPLGNGAGHWPKGDFVGVAEAWTPPTAQSGTGADLARVQAALMASPRPPRADQRSPEWIGWLVARVMGLDTGGHSTPKEDRTPDQAAALARVRAIVAGWVKSGGLVERQELDADTRKKHRFVFVGQPAVVLDENAADSPSDTDGADDEE